MENEYISEELNKIIQEIDQLSTCKERILYLEKLKKENEQSDAMYGIEFLAIDSKKYIESELKFQYSTLKFEDENSERKFEKIQWKGSPSLFGYLFTELIDKGFIEPKLHNGEMSYSGTAKLFLDHFDIYNKKGNLTTLENLKKEMNPAIYKNTYSETKRAKFKIPKMSDLS